MKKPLNQTVKKAIIAVTLSAIIGGVGGALVYMEKCNTDKTKNILKSYSGVEKVTLSQGENFWKYAGKYHPKDVDVRDYLQYVYDTNNKKPKVIDYPGDSLNFPVYSDRKEIKKQK